MSGGQTRVVKDVMVGEVWLCSGQSNMEWPVRWSGNFDAERAAANQPAIRMFTVPHQSTTRPQRDVEAEWRVCTPDTVGDFSATGYFFGRALQESLDVPMGLLHSSWGGTRIEPWIGRAGLDSHHEFRALIRDLDRATAEFEGMDEQTREAVATRQGQEFQKAVSRYWKETAQADPGTKQRWFTPSLDDKAWHELPLTSAWEVSGAADLAGFDGCVWLRTVAEIPDNWAGRDVTLHLPRIDDSDTTYVNGVQVGQTLWKWYAPRSYPVPGSAVKPGRAVIAIQAIDYGGAGGLSGTPDDLREHLALEVAGDVEPKKVAIPGPWRYRIGAPISDLPVPPREPPPLMHPGDRPTSPTVLYNGMIHPLAPYAIRGAIWYQGESNASEPEAYRKLLPILIESWRTLWDQPGPNQPFPFGVVQLANFGLDRPDEPAPGGWAWLRDAQLQSALHHPNTGLAVTIDIGDARDIHPKNKQDVGRRLALWALATAYGQAIEYSGPAYTKHECRDGRVVLHFDHVGGGLITRDGGPVKGFAVAGADHRFHWAETRIEGDTVVVASKAVPDPVAVRYGWADNPASANLANQAGLPASPFRTDDWNGE
jgi:sialate O-acetylesterase